MKTASDVRELVEKWISEGRDKSYIIRNAAEVDSLPELAEGIPNAFPARFDKPEEDEKTAEIIAKALNMPRSEKRTLCTIENMTAEYLALYQELKQKGGRK